MTVTKGEKLADRIVPPTELPAIEMRSVVTQHEGNRWREFLVRLPNGVTADDLKEPGLWRKIQMRPSTSLRVFDRLTVVAFDESWFAECRVIRADGAGAVLSIGKIVSMGDGRFDNLPGDELYRIAWSGNGYVVIRRSDNVVMTHAVRDLGQAARDMSRLHARAA